MSDTNTPEIKWVEQKTEGGKTYHVPELKDVADAVALYGNDKVVSLIESELNSRLKTKAKASEGTGLSLAECKAWSPDSRTLGTKNALAVLHKQFIGGEITAEQFAEAASKLAIVQPKAKTPAS